ncbi:uncharacterized protein C8Q71DRAFT_856830 [Rhodofomes roseus]|uniref:Uncharacterized protein n=1 Tax=Rhodofomes roseus TaxID=34475 RepID=A0ABQ8KI00_9APHY|nr:uncharacterized protein C8Q71DRAFT_856830 [Rhodofomes roseus]KAH9837631.1 hypothetical protein C8Q71DRAFT_856830 [Rhodofomes roseus]
MPDPAIQEGSDDEKLHDVYQLLEAAKKYEVARAVEFAKRQCVASIAACPVRLYLAALHNGWEDAMKEAAWRSVYEVSDKYVPEMATVPATIYRRLLVYRQKCRQIINARRDISKLSAPNEKDASDDSYWGKDSWLGGPGESEARFWLNIHRFVQEEAVAGRQLNLQPDVVFPISIRAPSDNTGYEVVTTTPKHSRGRGDFLSSRVYSYQVPVPTPNPWIANRQTAIDIAKALAKVEL